MLLLLCGSAQLYQGTVQSARGLIKRIMSWFPTKCANSSLSEEFELMWTYLDCISTLPLRPYDSRFHIQKCVIPIQSLIETTGQNSDAELLPFHPTLTYWTNEYTSNIGVGVYHSGVEVYGTEWAYGGHPFPFTGIFDITPKDQEELGENFKFKQSLEIGYTDLTKPEIENIVEQFGTEFRGDQYHLLKKNCNHFSEQLIEVLAGKKLPKWVNRLASISNSIPFIESMLPKEWLTPLALQEHVQHEQQSNT